MSFRLKTTTSVISSEMSATASLELLKASCRHFTQLVASPDKENKEITDTQSCYSAFYGKQPMNSSDGTTAKIIRILTCVADDHCQRYRGLPVRRLKSCNKPSRPLAVKYCYTEIKYAMPVSPNVAEELSKNFNTVGRM